jgi:hypothetical protein
MGERRTHQFQSTLPETSNRAKMVPTVLKTTSRIPLVPSISILNGSFWPKRIAAVLVQAARFLINPRLLRAAMLGMASMAVVDAHDGCLHMFGDRYYLYGTAYGTTDGFNKNNRYRCYSSADPETVDLREQE